jgi:hypothetical protein
MNGELPWWSIWSGVAVVVAWFWIFHGSVNIERRKRLFRPFAITLPAVLIFLLLYRSFADLNILLLIPFCLLMGWANLKFTKLCPSCGEVQYNRMLWERMNFCRKCGAPLDKEPPKSMIK